ncbi:hypothetical protein, partial [Halomonas sp. 707B3]|uniref:hypothetical protein n=1 Tax=Halomonas sp. 707B3 TaxID=1681043 RepID=UPI00209D172B
GHGTVWVNGDNGYIAMQVSGLEVLPGAGLTDSGMMIDFQAYQAASKKNKDRPSPMRWRLVNVYKNGDHAK